jgi:hypothetical protein
MNKKVFLETMKHYDIVMMGTVGFLDDDQVEHFLDLVEKASGTTQDAPDEAKCQLCLGIKQTHSDVCPNNPANSPRG